MKEMVERRTLNSKTFDMGGLNRRIVSRIRNIHYEDAGGKLQDVDMSIVSGRVFKCDYNIQLFSDKVGYSGTDPAGKHVELELMGVPYKAPMIERNIATWEDVAPNTDLKIIFLPTTIKVLRVLKTDKASKVCRFRSLREEGAVGKLVHRGIDNDKRETKLTLLEESGVVTDEKIITQTFEDQVKVMDPETRVKTWSENVQYPVVIDPTSTFSIAANADDGQAGAFMFGTPPPWTGASVDTTASWALVQHLAIGGAEGKYSSYLRFTVTGIPMGATINSATINSFGIVNSVPFSMTVKATSQSSPGVPTSVTAVFTPPSPIGTVTTTWTTPTLTAPLTTPAQFGPQATVVTTIVQALVAAFDYTNAPMLFLLNKAVPQTTGAPPGPQNTIYQRDWGVAQDAELVIDFDAGPSDKTDHDLSRISAA